MCVTTFRLALVWKRTISHLIPIEKKYRNVYEGSSREEYRE